jgi:hypothetical protein
MAAARQHPSSGRLDGLVDLIYGPEKKCGKLTDPLARRTQRFGRV